MTVANKDPMKCFYHWPVEFEVTFFQTMSDSLILSWICLKLIYLDMNNLLLGMRMICLHIQCSFHKLKQNY